MLKGWNSSTRLGQRAVDEADTSDSYVQFGLKALQCTTSALLIVGSQLFYPCLMWTCHTHHLGDGASISKSLPRQKSLKCLGGLLLRQLYACRAASQIEQFFV